MRSSMEGRQIFVSWVDEMRWDDYTHELSWKAVSHCKNSSWQNVCKAYLHFEGPSMNSWLSLICFIVPIENPLNLILYSHTPSWLVSKTCDSEFWLQKHTTKHRGRQAATKPKVLLSKTSLEKPLLVKKKCHVKHGSRHRINVKPTIDSLNSI